MRMRNIEQLRAQIDQFFREDPCIDRPVPQTHNEREHEWGSASARYLRLVTWTRDFRDTAGFEFMVTDVPDSQRRLVYQAPLWLHRILSGRQGLTPAEYREYPGDEVLYWLAVHAAGALLPVDSEDVRWFYRTYTDAEVSAMDEEAVRVVGAGTGSGFQLAPTLWYDMCRGEVYAGLARDRRKRVTLEEFTAMSPEAVLRWANSREFHRGRVMSDTADTEPAAGSPSAGIRQVKRRLR